MIRAIYFLLVLVSFNALCVYSQFDYDDFFSFENNNDDNNQQNNRQNNQQNNQQNNPQPNNQGTTTTLAPVQFTNCFQNCRQVTTPQYNPVCASNGQSYNNMGLLKCAQNCGLRISFSSPGTCGPSPGGK